MHLILLGLSQPRMQHLAMVLEQALTPVLPSFYLLTPDKPEELMLSTSPFRILLFASDPVEYGTTLWRHTLIMRGLPFQVIQAKEAGWVNQCLQALLGPEASKARAPEAQEEATRWQGVCESCSDPDCERRLFSGLLQA